MVFNISQRLSFSISQSPSFGTDGRIGIHRKRHEFPFPTVRFFPELPSSSSCASATILVLNSCHNSCKFLNLQKGALLSRICPEFYCHSTWFHFWYSQSTSTLVTKVISLDPNNWFNFDSVNFTSSPQPFLGWTYRNCILENLSMPLHRRYCVSCPPFIQAHMYPSCILLYDNLLYILPSINFLYGSTDRPMNTKFSFEKQ